VICLSREHDEAVFVAVAIEGLGDGGSVVLVIFEGLQVAERATLLLGELFPVLARRDVDVARFK
jgi:hypothetical protein